MTVKNTESLGNSSDETRSVFYCPESQQFIWDLHHTTSFKIIVAITTIACLVTILLNLLVIIAVKTWTELRENSNILLSSVALADRLVGAVSKPLNYHVRHVSHPESFSCGCYLYNRFYCCLFNVHYLWCVTFAFASNCLGEVCSDSEMNGVQGYTYCYERPCEHIHENCMAGGSGDSEDDFRSGCRNVSH